MNIAIRWDYHIDGNNSVWKSECKEYMVVVKHGLDGTAIAYDFTGDFGYSEIVKGVRAHKRAMSMIEIWKHGANEEE